MGKILLYYKYVRIEDPESIMHWQKELCARLGMRGRILIAKEGINGTVGGTDEAAAEYIKKMKAHHLFADVVFKWSEGCAEDFPRAKIVVRETIVNLGIDPEELTVADGGVHLTPEQVHELLQNKPDDLIILDTRNRCETAIGKFTDAIIPDIDTFRDFPKYVDEHAHEYKDKQVLMYCTGGVRCERATAYLKKKGIAKEVYQIEGGIHCYAQKFPNGFFRGKNYVFDDRIALKINDDILATCASCTTPCDRYLNCRNALCNAHFICCDTCNESLQECCSTTCRDLILSNGAPERPRRCAHEHGKAQPVKG